MAKKVFYTITEAAKKLKITRAALHKAIHDGRISAAWTTIEQTLQKRARVIAAKSLDGFKVDRAQQGRGKKTDSPG